MAKKQEIIEKSIRNDNNPISRAKKIRILFKKNKGLIKDKEAMTEFKEPVVMLMRRSRAVEFFEDASKGEFIFKHSDGKTRSIYLEPSQQVSFDYGKRKFRGYICHEDYPLPLPEIPIVTADTINMIVEKSMMDLKKLNERAEEIKLKTYKMLIWGIVICGILYMLWKSHAIDKIIGMLTGQPYVDPASIVNHITTNNTQNINSLGVQAGA